MRRRRFLSGLGGLATAAALPAGCRSSRRPERAPRRSPESERVTGRTPAAFVSHLAPLHALDDGGVFGRLAGAIGERPRAVLVVSAHWVRAPLALGATRTLPLIHDYGGFDAVRRVTYAAPGAPHLADRVEGLIGAVERRPERGWDHGVWVPLRRMFPDASVPVLQLSIPGTEAPASLFELGRRLSPLREEGVLVLGSGGLTHNLRQVSMQADAPVATWARDFDEWAVRTLAAWDVDSLLDYEQRAPAARLAHPTTEHFVPLLVAAGAASAGAPTVTSPSSGFFGGSLSTRSFVLAEPT